MYCVQVYMYADIILYSVIKSTVLGAFQMCSVTLQDQCSEAYYTEVLDQCVKNSLF